MSDASGITMYILILLIGIGTWLIRMSFIYWFAGQSPGPRARKLLSYIPAAALSAIIFPGILNQGGQLALTADNHRLIALLVAIIVAWVSKNTLAVLGAGMTTLWLVDYFF